MDYELTGVPLFESNYFCSRSFNPSIQENWNYAFPEITRIRRASPFRCARQRFVIQFIGQFNKEGSSVCTTLRKYRAVERRAGSKRGGAGTRIRVENSNYPTKLPRNQVYGNPRAFEDFATILQANYVSDMSRYV